MVVVDSGGLGGAPLQAKVCDPFAEPQLHVQLAILLGRLQSAEPWRFRYLAHEESVVWGLTERIVAGLAPKLKQALGEDQKPDPPAAGA